MGIKEIIEFRLFLGNSGGVNVHDKTQFEIIVGSANLHSFSMQLNTLRNICKCALIYDNFKSGFFLVFSFQASKQNTFALFVRA